jgi:hypothetical protein
MSHIITSRLIDTWYIIVMTRSLGYAHANIIIVGGLLYIYMRLAYQTLICIYRHLMSFRNDVYTGYSKPVENIFLIASILFSVTTN